MIGQTVAHYKILEKLGEGGMGVVYKAQDTKLDRAVALKFLPQHLTVHDAERARFLQEARAASSLSHSNICVIHDFEEYAGEHYIVMEFIDGVTLREKIAASARSNDRMLPLDSVISFSIQIGEALQEAHGKGVVHRDVKAENIMVTAKNQIKVMDFGLAKLKGSLKLTRTSSTVGTLSYMAPEQLQGADVDGRTDLFSLGVVMYEMLTGHLPFQGEHEAAIMYSILNQEPASIAAQREDVSSEMERIVRKALEKMPERRYQNTGELIADLVSVRARMSAPTASTGQTETTTLRTIAVLPFANLSAEKEQEYFCDGMAEEIINALSQVKGLAVVARTSAFAFKGKQEDIRDIGRKLNVSAVLEGSVRKSGSRLRISAQLIDVSSGFQLWSDRFDRNADDVFAIQDEISQAIVATLKIRLVGGKNAALVKVPTDNLEAYNLFLKGRYFWSKRTERGLYSSIEYFNNAIAEDPGYAVAYAALADSYSLLCSYHLLSPEESIVKARSAAMKAAELDHSLAEAYEALGHVEMLYGWNWGDAERSYKRAIELNPRYATARQRHALLLGVLGRRDEAVAEIRKAEQLDPLSLIINTDTALISYICGDYDGAITKCRSTLEIDPEFSVALFVLGLALQQKGILPEAITQFQKATIVPGASTIMKGALAHGLAVAGETQQARAIVAELESLSGERYISPYSIGAVYAALGDVDAAFGWLRKALDTRSVWLIHLHLNVDPRLEPLRKDLRFQALLKETGVGA